MSDQKEVGVSEHESCQSSRSHAIFAAALALLAAKRNRPHA